MFILSLFFGIALYFYSKKNTFRENFHCLSFFYIFAFYIYPLKLISESSSFYYVEALHTFSKDELYISIVSLLIFLLGFLSIDTIKKFSPNKNNRTKKNTNIPHQPPILNEKTKNRKNKIFYAVLLLVTLHLLFNIFDSDRAAKLYDIRKGDASSDWIAFLTSLIFSSLTAISLIYSISINNKKIASFIFILALGNMLTGSPGRASLLFIICIYSIYLLNIKLNKFILIIFFAFPFLIPILLNLKSIIYDISVNKVFPNILESYSSDVITESLLNNFGHPLISLIAADNVTEIIGFRFFYDYIHGFLFYLKAIGLDFGSSLIYYNTEVLYGVHKSIIPTGYLAFGYIQFSYLGIFISGIFYSLIGYFSEYVYKKSTHGGEAAKFYFVYLAASSFYHGEVRVMVITYLMPLMLFLAFSKFNPKNS